MLKNYKIADRFKEQEGKMQVIAGAFGVVPLDSALLSDNIAKSAVKAGSPYFEIVEAAPKTAAKPVVNILTNK